MSLFPGILSNIGLMANYYGYGVSGMALNGTLRRGVIWAPVHMNRTSQASRDNTPEWDKYQLGFMIYGKNSSHFPGIALESTGASAF